MQRINLSLPRHWNQCTTEQLELIADVMREQVERSDRYRPFSMQNVKIAMFFALAGLEIVEGPNPRIPVEEQYYTCKMKTLPQPPSPGWGLLRLFRKPVGETFSLYLWQINYWLSPKETKTNTKTKTDTPQSAEINKITAGAGMLDWLDNENDMFLTKFPYSEIKRRKYKTPLPWGGLGWAVPFRGPLTDLDGFSWAQYRMATDAMQSYMKLSNSLIKMRQMRSFSDEQMRQQARNVELAKAMFLAVLFIGRTKFVDTNTGIIKKDFHYESNQITDNAQYFRNYPETQWQVILFWWTGIMHSLSKRYPHVFKVQKVDKKQQEQKSPLDIYSATIATMQKYVGLDENQCNNQSYSLVLEQLERMSKENEEVEKMRRKK